MLINSMLDAVRKPLQQIYNNSFILQNIDRFILFSIIAVIFSSVFAASDLIGYLAILTILLTAVKMLFTPEKRFDVTPAEICLLFYFIFVLISVTGSTNLYLSFKGFIKTLTYLGFYVAVVEYLKDNLSDIKYLILSMVTVCLIETAAAFKQNFLSVSEISGWQDTARLNPEEVMTRVYGTLKPYNPNLFGGYMLSIFPSMIFLPVISFYKKHYKLFLISSALLLASICAIFMTGCRGAYIGLLAEFTVIAILIYKYTKPYYRKLYLFLMSVLAGLAAIVMFSMTSIRARIFSIFAMRNDSSNSFRFNVYNSCIDMFKDNWLLGIGVGNQNFREVYGLYMKTGFDALSAYNIYLETAVESGIFALIAFVSFLIYNLISAVKYVLSNQNERALYVIIALVSIIGILFHGLVDTVFFRPQIQLVFWLMMGIIRVITKDAYDKRRDSKN